MSDDDEYDERGDLIPQPPPPWPPEQAEVDRWLAAYKLWTVNKQPQPPGMTMGGGDQFEKLELRLGKGAHPDAASQYWMDQMRLFEDSYGAYERFRRSIGQAHGLGYDAGRANAPRESLPFTERTHEVYSWLNGWAVGNLDYRFRRGELQLPRSPGVTRAPKRLVPP